MGLFDVASGLGLVALFGYKSVNESGLVLASDWPLLLVGFVATGLAIDILVIQSQIKNLAVLLLPVITTLLGAQQIVPGLDSLLLNIALTWASFTLISGRFYVWETLELFFYIVFGLVSSDAQIKALVHLMPDLPLVPRFTNAFWNLFYATFSWYFKKHGFVINSMNWGYHNGEEENKQQLQDSLVLSKEQIMQVLPDCSLWEVEKFSLQLYRKNISAVPGGLAGKDLADVSCGKGGGIRMLSELGSVGDKTEPKTTVGMDFSPVNVAECKASYTSEGKRRPVGLSFTQGSATHMPFADASKDVIVSVEASHCYPSKLAFLKEAHRSLKPDGRLCVIDFMRENQYADYKRWIEEAGLVLERDESVREEVLRASAKVSAEKEAIIEERAPWYMKYFARRFFNTADSVTFNKFASHVYDYRWFTIRKA